jgi:nucleoside-diphosphate-sugar epimerase
MTLDNPERSPAGDRDLPELPILSPDEEPDGTESPRPTVLITGACGNLGRKLREAWRGVYDLIPLDRVADPHDPEVIAADLAVFDPDWVDLFDEADAVVHLAANPSEFATWADLEGPNLDALFHVFQAAALAGVERIVFASSNHAMGDYRFDGSAGPITVDLPPKPDGPYGGTKLIGERFGLSLSRFFDITCVAVRIGWVQRGENRPDTLPDDWSRSIWLSNADFVRLMTQAVEADLGDRRFLVVNGVSANRGTRWDLSSATQWLGYHPEDDAWALPDSA